jgi:hypothetical protein
VKAVLSHLSHLSQLSQTIAATRMLLSLSIGGCKEKSRDLRLKHELYISLVYRVRRVRPLLVVSSGSYNRFRDRIASCMLNKFPRSRCACRLDLSCVEECFSFYLFCRIFLPCPASPPIRHCYCYSMTAGQKGSFGDDFRNNDVRDAYLGVWRCGSLDRDPGYRYFSERERNR